MPTQFGKRKQGIIFLPIILCFLFVPFLSFAQKTQLVVPSKHSKRVGAAIYSSNGEKVITMGADNAIKIWRAKDGFLLSTIIDTVIGEYRNLSLLPTNGLAFLETDKGYQILDYQKNQIVTSKRIPKYSGGILIEGTSEFYYAKGADAAPGEKAIYKIYKRNVTSGADEELLTQFNDLEGRIAWPIGFYGTKLGQNLLIKTSGMHCFFFNVKDNSLKKFEGYRYIDKTPEGIIDYSYDISQLGNLIEFSHYRGKNDFKVKYIDINTNATLKSLDFEGVSLISVHDYGVICATKSTTLLYDETTNKTISTAIPFGQNVLFFDDKQNKFITADNKTSLDVSIYDVGSFFLYMVLGGKTIYSPNALEDDKSHKRFWLASGKQRKYLNISDGRIRLASNQNASSATANIFPDFEKNTLREIYDDSIFTYRFSDSIIALVNTYYLNDIIQKEFPQKDPYAFCMSDDASLVAIGNSHKTIIYNLAQKRVINTYNLEAVIDKICFSANNEFFFYSGHLEETLDDSRARLICYKTQGSAQKEKKKTRWNVQKIQVFKNEPERLHVVVASTFDDADKGIKGNEGYYELHAKNGNVIQYTKGYILWKYNNTKIMQDTKTAMYSVGKYIFSISKSGVTQVADRYNAPAFTSGYSYFYNNEFLIYPLAVGSYAIYDITRSLIIGELYLFNHSNDWLLLTRDGRFDGTEAATKSLYYVKGDAVIEMDAVYEKFYTPNLLMRLLSRETLPPVNIDIDNLRPKPRAKILYAEAKRNLVVSDDVPSYVNTSGTAEITVSATAPDDKVDEIRLFHNGKAVNLATRGLFVTDNDGSDSKKYSINLLPGNNNFRAIALNSQRTESDADEINVLYKKDGSAPAPPRRDDNTAQIDDIDRKATLHIMVVGINAYKNKINPLKYALPDATAFKEELERDAKSMIDNVKSYLITDDAASKAGIVAAFDNIKKSAKPEDVFVFYYAGHGYIHPDNKEFYLVSSDVLDGGESLLKNGISSKDLQSFAVDIPAQKQLFIMDACQSAGAFEKMLQHDGEQQKALAVVSRSTGTHWMAASGSTETAKEFGELGHGVFTYSLLEALKGKAVNNKMITVNSLKNYLQNIVPELVKKYGGNSQYPASYGFGKDFPVEIVK